MERVTYLCDMGPADKPCCKETNGYHILLPCDPNGRLTGSNLRVDICEYHEQVLFAALRGKLGLPRDPAEAACP